MGGREMKMHSLCVGACQGVGAGVGLGLDVRWGAETGSG